MNNEELDADFCLQKDELISEISQFTDDKTRSLTKLVTILDCMAIFEYEALADKAYAQNTVCLRLNTVSKYIKQGLDLKQIVLGYVDSLKDSYPHDVAALRKIESLIEKITTKPDETFKEIKGVVRLVGNSDDTVYIKLDTDPFNIDNIYEDRTKFFDNPSWLPGITEQVKDRVDKSIIINPNPRYEHIYWEDDDIDYGHDFFGGFEKFKKYVESDKRIPDDLLYAPLFFDSNKKVYTAKTDTHQLQLRVEDRTPCHCVRCARCLACDKPYDAYCLSSFCFAIMRSEPSIIRQSLSFYMRVRPKNA